MANRKIGRKTYTSIFKFKNKNDAKKLANYRRRKFRESSKIIKNPVSGKWVIWRAKSRLPIKKG